MIQFTTEELRNYPNKLVGANLPGDQLTEVIDSNSIIILHFLRHLGCMFCKEQVDQLYKMKQKNPAFPPVIFVHQSSVEMGNTFFAKHYPDAVHISDPKLELYKHFGIRRVKGLQLLNPMSIIKGIGLTIRGYINRTKGFGDLQILNGTFLFHNGKLAWSHRAKYMGDDPNFSKLL